MIDELLQDPRVTVRRGFAPNVEGRAVVYWLQRSQRGIDNPALDLAINVANELARPVVVLIWSRVSSELGSDLWVEACLRATGSLVRRYTCVSTCGKPHPGSGAKTL